MIEYEDECVGCPPEIGCIGELCPNKRVPHFFCDSCCDETQLYHYEGVQLCAKCILERLEKVEG